jgi:aspartyl-tRNA(Asn)/glutamyl-tRNA(Gln) amidotransferase subunit A
MSAVTPPTDPILSLSARGIAGGLASGDFSAREVNEAFLARVEAVDGEVGAFLQIDRDDILAAADAADERRRAGEARSAFDGMPVGMKDVIAVKGQPLTCASRMLANFIAPYDATVTTRLRAAGLIPAGRLNMDEFAMGSSTENSALGKTRNPVDLTRAPGGSSGGSAAAVAAHEMPWTLGSDTGGSIRQPAAFCGIVGLKPTYGRVSRYGLVAYASSLDQIGPMGRTVDDVAALLDLFAGPDPKDSTSWPDPPPVFSEGLDQAPARPWRIGLPKECFGEGLDPDVRAAVEQAIATLTAQGCEIVDVSLPHSDLAIPVYYVIATAEASANLARYDGVRYGHRAADVGDAIDLYFKSRGEGFGPEVKRRVLLGAYVLSSGYKDAYYIRAQKVRSLIRKDFTDAFARVDALLTPTTPTPAFPLGEKTSDPLAMYLADIYTISANLAGLPAISIPGKPTPAGLPTGLQLLAPHWEEHTLLRIARTLQ